MRKNRIVMALLALVAGSAWAQSSVTLYGVADMALESVKGATTTQRMVSGQQQGSRWGVRGSEDLGGGLKAVFQIESGLNMANGALGQGGLGFGRQAYVGVSGGFGSVRMGRQYSPMDDIASVIGTKTYDVFSVVPVIGNGDYNRVNNAINYFSPSFANTTVQLQYSTGQQRPQGDTSASFGKLFSANALHASGPLTLGVGFIRVADADGVASGKQGKDALMLVGAYDFGVVKLSAYMNQEDKAAEKLKLLGVAAAFRMGEATVSVGAAQARNVNGAAGKDDARIYTLQGSYNLSKRTALYSHLTAVSNKGSAALGFNSPLAGSSSSGVQVGVRHRF